MPWLCGMAALLTAVVVVVAGIREYTCAVDPIIAGLSASEKTEGPRPERHSQKLCNCEHIYFSSFLLSLLFHALFWIPGRGTSSAESAPAVHANLQPKPFEKPNNNNNPSCEGPSK